MQGQLFTQDFLRRGVCETPAWEALAESDRTAFKDALHAVLDGRRVEAALNEAQTEQEAILPVLKLLGWGDDTLPQVNLSARGRQDVPDHLLFADAQHKAKALEQSADDQRYRHGPVILEAKRWLRPLDRGDASDIADPDAPSSQMLRYLSRADVMSDLAAACGCRGPCRAALCLSVPGNAGVRARAGTFLPGGGSGAVRWVERR